MERLDLLERTAIEKELDDAFEERMRARREAEEAATAKKRLKRQRKKEHKKNAKKVKKGKKVWDISIVRSEMYQSYWLVFRVWTKAMKR